MEKIIEILDIWKKTDTEILAVARWHESIYFLKQIDRSPGGKQRRLYFTTSKIATVTVTINQERMKKLLMMITIDTFVTKRLHIT